MDWTGGLTSMSLSFAGNCFLIPDGLFIFIYVYI